MPEKRALGTLNRKCGLEEAVSYSELADIVRKGSISYTNEGVVPGDRVAVVLPTGIRFVASFLSVMATGATPVPLPSGASSAERRRSLLTHARPSFVVSAEEEDGFSCLPACGDLPFDQDGPSGNSQKQLKAARTNNAPDGKVKSQDLAFIQYTSGSTSFPKGVEVTHEMLAHNLEYIRSSFQHDESSVFVGWLPNFHDMGLVGMLLQPLYCGATSYLMRPAHFVRDPLSWLKAISDWKGTTSGAPNSAYEACIAAIGQSGQLDGLDLSSWTIAFNGSEPVRKSTMDRFSRYFASAGFRPTSFFPCFGMAEGCLFISGGEVGSGCVMQSPTSSHRPNNQFASSGKVDAKYIDVKIVDAEQRCAVPSGEIGEVWFSGPSATHRYFADEEATEANLCASLKDDTRRYVRTGDLGFMIEGTLCVTGRTKDVIVINGRNIHPEDIEYLVRKELRGCGQLTVAAFGVDNTVTEQVVVLVAPSKRMRDQVRERLAHIKTAIFEHFEGIAAICELTHKSDIPTTSSGKIMRSASRERFLSNNKSLLAARDMKAGADDGLPLFQMLRQSVGADSDLHHTPIELGYDSLRLARFAGTLMERYNKDIPSIGKLAQMTLLEIAELPQRLQSDGEIAGSGPKLRAGQNGNHASGSRLLASLNQQSFVFHEHLFPAHPRSCFGFVLTFSSSMPIDVLRQSVGDVVSRHSALCLRISRDGALYRSEVPELTLDSVASTPDAYDRASRHIRLSISLFDTSLAKFHIFKSPDNIVLAVNVHHAICDLWSVEVLIADLNRALQGLSPTIDTPDYLDFVAEQASFLSSKQAEAMKARWYQRLEGRSAVINYPRSQKKAPKLCAEPDVQRFQFSQSFTEKVDRFARENGVTHYALFVTAFAVALSRFARQTEMIIATPFHGRRPGLDDGAIGLYENLLPFPIDLDMQCSFAASVKRQFLECCEIFEDGHLPFNQLQNGLQEAKKLPLRGFDAMFTLQSASTENHQGIKKSALRERGQTVTLGDFVAQLSDISSIAIETPLDLCLAVDDKIYGYLAVNRDVVDAAFGARLLQTFELILSAGVDMGEEPLNTLPFLSEGERASLLGELATGPGAPKPYRLAPSLFAAAARSHDTKIAVSDCKTALTYDQLDNASTNLAQRIRSRLHK